MNDDIPIHRRKRRAALILGTITVTVGVLGITWAIVHDLGTWAAYGALAVIIGLQLLNIGYVLQLISADWPPSIVFAAGQDAERRRAQREAQRSRLASVALLRRPDEDRGDLGGG